jgi:hypothetical protein
MKAYDVQKSVSLIRAGGATSIVDTPVDIFDDAFIVKALNVVIPILEVLAVKAAGWKFWLSWGMRLLIKALKGYLKGLEETP